MDLTKLSRYISLILRHKPEVIGISLDEHGWANVDELITGIAKNNPGFNRETLEEIVKTDLYLTYRNTGKAAKLFGVPRLMEIDFFVFCDILQLSKECDDILLTILISEVQVWKELKP